jgi:hypothetical protein
VAHPDTGAAPHSPQVVQVYGVTLSVDWQPRAPLLSTTDARPELTVERVASVPEPSDAAELLTKGGELDGLYRLSDGFHFSFAGVVQFHVMKDRMVYEVLDETYAYAVELWLLGTVLSFWLEWQQRPALHASAAVIDGYAAGFMATNKGGKSSLAATLMRQGHPLLTDDIVALTPGTPPLAHPGFPQMRMWPEQAAHFVDDVQALETVHPFIDKKRVPVDEGGIGGAFCQEACPLAALYIPDRSDDVEAISIEPLPQSEALLSIVRESFVATLIEAAGWQGRRLHLLSSLVKAAPVRRLMYPNGLDLLPEVAQAVADDVRRSVTAAA